jgi:hypothetical protein
VQYSFSWTGLVKFLRFCHCKMQNEKRLTLI